MTESKKVYQAPALTTFGSVEEITAGSKYGEATDRDFPAGTPKGDLTFS